MQLISIAAFLHSIIFLISIFVIHKIRIDLKFKRYALSTYALGASGWLLSFGLLAIGCAQILLSVRLANMNGFTFGHGVLMCAGIATFFIALYKMEYPNQTYRGRIHTVAAGLQFTLFPIALLLLYTNFTNTLLAYFTLCVAVLNIVFLSLIFSYFLKGTTHTVPHFGLVQKTNILIMTAWVTLISLYSMF